MRMSSPLTVSWRGNQIREAPGPPASSRGVIRLRLLVPVQPLPPPASPREEFSSGGRSDTREGTCTAFRALSWLPTSTNSSAAADVEANKNTSTGSTSTPTAGSRDQVTYPHLWESYTTPTCALGKGTIFHGFVFKKINVWPFSGAEWDAPSNVWFNKLTLSFELCHPL